MSVSSRYKIHAPLLIIVAVVYNIGTSIVTQYTLNPYYKFEAVVS